jgi:hypothetical protein
MLRHNCAVVKSIEDRTQKAFRFPHNQAQAFDVQRKVLRETYSLM